ncbi:hypothetical protein ROJ8625_04123 [Roseivivax jejudonensis]|uniref:Uncharacterized protein n=1 Tax=Roseivivax jejudonensis TaxID=1529041 RepID=A0A1X7ADJ6_9RHOB|nr:hypothetical protein ROJ8625_04123 [Roseivivax jejudonensis]
MTLPASLIAYLDHLDICTTNTADKPRPFNGDF